MRKILLVTTLVLFICSNNIFAGGHKWHAGIFTGATTNFHAEHTDFTLGADIEYRLGLTHNLFGIGVIGDIVFAEHQENLVMGAVFVHPLPSLKFVIANGVAITSVESHGIEETESTHVIRFGTAYDIHISNFSISPTVNYDIIHGHGSLAYGLTFGIGF